jgi:hypothetical protein
MIIIIFLVSAVFVTVFPYDNNIHTIEEQSRQKFLGIINDVCFPLNKFYLKE